MLRNYWIIAGTLVSIAAVLFLLTGWHLSAPERTLERFEQAIRENKAEKLQGLMISADKKTAFDKKAAGGLLLYLKEEKDVFTEAMHALKEEIREGSFDSDAVLTLTPSDKFLFFFTTYRVKIKPQMITVSGQQEGDRVSLKLEGKSVPQTEEKDRFGPVFPGKYRLEKFLTNELGLFVKKEQIALWGDEVTVQADTAQWVRSDPTFQKQVMASVHQFNAEVSEWETADYHPDKLPSATETFRMQQSQSRMAQFATIRSHLEAIESSYLGMTVNLDSIEISRYGGRWNASIETVVSYKYVYWIKGDSHMYDDSYQRGVVFRMIWEAETRQWLIHGMDDTWETEEAAKKWTHKEKIRVQKPEVSRWQAEKGSNL
ncbi:hypothetical protein [Sporolactobacillus sp. THM19-2]|jgi:hypothetical protein|uniref:TcaA second domain-containing protein n=1 Tax=Sporolactobacillus sp. THM19-2 TaxID=2511171 RepID=UPI001021580D|nr:hypothetical protein [Sporolactobacillus sp. THM19-2]RYL90935.1 hypothetical protein EWH91_09245 [Sporolactobacillus sp. THM19-2]